MELSLISDSEAPDEGLIELNPERKELAWFCLVTSGLTKPGILQMVPEASSADEQESELEKNLSGEDAVDLKPLVPLSPQVAASVGAPQMIGSSKYLDAVAIP